MHFSPLLLYLLIRSSPEVTHRPGQATLRTGKLDYYLQDQWGGKHYGNLLQSCQPLKSKDGRNVARGGTKKKTSCPKTAVSDLKGPYKIMLTELKRCHGNHDDKCTINRCQVYLLPISEGVRSSTDVLELKRGHQAENQHAYCCPNTSPSLSSRSVIKQYL